MKPWVSTLLAALLAAIPSAACALGGPDSVLVVQNSNSPVSQRVAAHYMTARGVPSGNLVSIATPDSSLSASNEFITPTDFESLIRQPIKTFLAVHGLTDTIQYIVLTKGIPHRFTNEPSEGSRGGRSVDSMLAATDLVNPLQWQITEGYTVSGVTFINRYWRAADPFTHAKYGGYLVTRLDGYTEADAKLLVDRALASQGPPYRVLLDVDPSFGSSDPAAQPKSVLTGSGEFNTNYDLYYSDFNADLFRASQITSGRPHLSVWLEPTNTFALDLIPLTCYVSWGSNDHHFSSTAYRAEPFAARGIAETAVSTSARTLLATTGGQSLITDLIAQRVSGARGASGIKGYVTEPFLDAIASPSVLVDLYTSGRNLAESYYAASRFIGWKDVVLGDPLCSVTGSVVTSVAAAKSVHDGWLVSLSGAIVSAGSDAFGDRFYVQDSQGVSGIQVRLGVRFPGITEGMVVSVRGLLTTTNGERAITNASVSY